MTVDSGVRPLVRSWTAGYGVVSAIEFAGPLAVHGGAAAISAIDGDLGVVAGGLVNNGVVFGRPGSEFRFCFVQLPGTHMRIIG